MKVPWRPRRWSVKKAGRRWVEKFRRDRARMAAAPVVAIMAGLLPILWSHGTGSEVMQRIAVPMIGGMVSSTILTLIVIPAVYALVKGFGLTREGAVPAAAAAE
jgi:copper/silver efflux system protein